VAAARPVVAHVVAALPAAVVSQMDGVSSRFVAPAPAAAPEPRVRLQRSEKAPVATPSPIPQIRFKSMSSPNVAVNTVMVLVGGMELQEASGTASLKGTAYLDGMRDAGYALDLNNDLNTLVSLKSLGVTPEYAKSMGAAGLGKPTVHELITLKSLGVTPEYVAALKQSGIAPKNFHEVVTEKSLGVTPEYAAEMKQKGFGDLDLHELIAMKSLGVTPEYAAAMKQKGFGDMNAHELISLKAQGMTPEYAGWLKQQFPQATMEELRRAAVFHLDEKFLANAKAHGFDGNNLDKLLRLKMSGLLDE
jgi:bla regulator protein blaR1